MNGNYRVDIETAGVFKGAVCVMDGTVCVCVTHFPAIAEKFVKFLKATGGGALDYQPVTDEQIGAAKEGDAE